MKSPDRVRSFSNNEILKITDGRIPDSSYSGHGMRQYPSGNVADIPSHISASRALTEKDLANATYRINGLGMFHLDNGEFIRQYGEGVTQRHKVTLDHDGLSDAAVILAWQSGGSGTFKYLMEYKMAVKRLLIFPLFSPVFPINKNSGYIKKQ